MRVSCISNIYYPFIQKPIIKYDNNKNNTSKPLGGDIVSFSSKKYGEESIINPTNHCAYCGCKVYSEQQINSIALEILSCKSGRLEGKLKSILEKLEGAKQSEELLIAKKSENAKQIEFFKNLMKLAEKKPYLKGNAIFQEFYNLNEDEAMKVLAENMRPILKTIDHISPQREKKENNNTDVNLVEACRCCNHNIKKGMSFQEFYSMFPSIKNNMPAEKFRYALANMPDFTQIPVKQRISASNMIKHVDRLFVERQEAENHLASVDYRIKCCKPDIEYSIKRSEDEIVEKTAAKNELQAKYNALLQDKEFEAMINREQLYLKLASVRSNLSDLREKKQKTIGSLNEFNKTKNIRSSQSENPPEQDRQNESLTEILNSLNKQIMELEEEETAVELKIEKSLREFPDTEILKSEKAKAEHIIRNYNLLQTEKNALQEKITYKDSIIEKRQGLHIQYTAEFNANNYSNEEQMLLDRYKELLDALDYINAHPNGGNIKILINKAAKIHIDSELESIEKSKIVTDYNDYINYLRQKEEYDKLTQQLQEADNQIKIVSDKCARYEEIIKGYSLEQAQEQIKNCTEAIKRLNEKQNNMKIPKRILAAEAEILLLRQTIDDLRKKQEEIDEHM